MQSKAIRDGPPAAGFSRVTIGNNLILVGEGDGTIKCFTVANFSKNPAPVWSREVHMGQVTSLVFCHAIDAAFSCGRDGKIFMHYQCSSPTPPDPMQLVSVTGELNCLAVTPDGHRLFFAGDSVRCFILESSKVHTVGITVAYPVVSLAVTPCGSYVAMVSATGDVGVVDFDPNAIGGSASSEKDSHHLSIRSILSRIVPRGNSAEGGRGSLGDIYATRIAWVYNSHKQTNTLCVPTEHGVQLYALIEDLAGKLASVNPFSASSAGSNPVVANTKPKGRLHLIATVAAQAIDPIFSISAEQATKHKFEIIIAGKQSNRLICYRVDDHNPKKIKENLHIAIEVSSSAAREGREKPTVFDFDIDKSTGTIAIVDSTGTITIQRQFAAVHSAAAQNNSTANNKETKTKGENTGDASHSTDLQQETQLVIDGVSQSQRGNGTNGGVATFGKSSKTDPNSTKHSKESQKKRRPSFIEDEAEEGSSDSQDGADDDDLEEDDEALSSRESDFSSEDPMEEARRVEEEYRRRYGLGKYKNSKNDPVKKRHRHASDVEDDKYGKDADLYDDFGGDHAEEPTIKHLQKNKFHGNMGDELLARGQAFAAARNLYTLQPGSTPYSLVQSEDGVPVLSDSRYLAFNSVGALRVVTSEQSVFAHFHDMTKATIKVQEKRKALLGAMGVYAFALILLDEKHTTMGENVKSHKPDVGNRHVIFYRPFKSLGLQSDWSLTLPEGEHALNLAIGNRFLAVFTNHYMRVFSPSGLELAVVSLPFHVVAATGYNSASHAAIDPNSDPLCIVYMEGAGDVYVKVLDASNDGAVILPPTPIALTTFDKESDEQATLQWVGWSDDGILHVVDSSGAARRLHSLWGTSWVPVYDPSHRLAGGEMHWVWGATPTHLMTYRCTGAEGDLAGERFPAANNSLPPVHRIAICLPLLRSNVGGDKAMLTRETFIREYIKVQEVKAKAKVYDETVAGMDALLDKELMRQFQQAVIDGKSSRAVDISSMFQLVTNVDEAARFANDRQERLVTEKLLQVLATRKKLKKRRLSTLPFAQEVSDKDKERIIKKLYEAEKAGIPIVGGITPSVLPQNSIQSTHRQEHAEVAPVPTSGSTPQRHAPQQRHTNLLISPSKELVTPSLHGPNVLQRPNASTTPQKRVVFEDDNSVTELSPQPKLDATPHSVDQSKNGIGKAEEAPVASTPKIIDGIHSASPSAAKKPSNPFSSPPSSNTPAATKKPLNPFAKPSAAISSTPPASAPRANPMAVTTPQAPPNTASQQSQTRQESVAVALSPAKNQRSQAAFVAQDVHPSLSPNRKNHRAEKPSVGASILSAAPPVPDKAETPAPSLSPSHHQPIKLSISSSASFSTFAPRLVDTTQRFGNDRDAPKFNDISAASDPFASLVNESSVSEFAGLNDIGHLGEAPQALLAALKRTREDDEDEEDNGGIQLSF